MDAAALAAHCGVTRATVYNWHRNGLPSCGTDGQGRRLFRRSDAEAWVAANVIEGGKGGKRPGAGRPRRNGRVAGSAPADGAPVDTASQSRVEAQRAKTELECRRLELELRKREGELLEREEVRATWAAFVADLGAALESLAVKIANRQAAALGLNAEQLRVAQDEAAAEIADMRRRLADDQERGATS